MKNRRLCILLRTLCVGAALNCASGQTVIPGQGAAVPPAAAAGPGEGITHQQADEILQELREIHRLLAAGAKVAPGASGMAGPSTVQLRIEGLPVLGRADAPLTMVEFSDYQCPFCRAFHTGAFLELKKNWIDTGKLRFISWNLPLDIHNHAMEAAQAGLCAAEQGKFWEMRDVMIAHADKLAAEDIAGYARVAAVPDVERFQTCVQSGKYAAMVRRGASDANGLGVTGTPSFLIGKTNGAMLTGTLLVGAKPYADFDAGLQAASK